MVPYELTCPCIVANRSLFSWLFVLQVVPNGFGIGYGSEDRLLRFCITSFSGANGTIKTAAEYSKELEKTIREMAVMFPRKEKAAK